MIRLCRILCQADLAATLPPLPTQELLLVGEWVLNGSKSADLDYLRRCVSQARPDLVLLIGHPVNTAIIAALKSADHTPPCFLVTDFSRDDLLLEAIRLGVCGFWPLEALSVALLPALRQAASGECALHPTLTTRVLRLLQRMLHVPESAERLTPRETDILHHVAQGCTNRQIADRLVVSERTVRTHMTNILAKLHLSNRTQAAMYAVRTGIAEIDRPA